MQRGGRRTADPPPCSLGLPGAALEKPGGQGTRGWGRRGRCSQPSLWAHVEYRLTNPDSEELEINKERGYARGVPARLQPTEAGPRLGQMEVSFPLSAGANKAGTLAIPETPAGMARSSRNRNGARRDPGADVPGGGTRHATGAGASGRLLGPPPPPGTPAREARASPQQSSVVWEGRKGLLASGLPPGSLALGRG